MTINKKDYHWAVTAFISRSVATFSFALAGMLLLESLGVSALMRGSALSLMMLVTLLLDLPMGVLADRISNKTAVAIACFSDFIAFSLMLLAHSFPGIVFIAFAFRGAATALESGALRLLVLDSARGAFEDPEEGKRKSALDIQNGLRMGSILGATLALFSLRFSPYIPLGICILSSLIAGVCIRNLSIDLHRQKKFESVEGWYAQVKRGFQALAQPAMLPLLFYAILEGIRNGTDTQVFSIYARDVLGGVKFLWLLPLLSFAIRYPANKKVHKMNLANEKLGSGTLLSFAGVGFSFLMMGLFPHPVVAVLCFSLNFILYSFRDYWFDNWQIGLIERDAHVPRATVMSAISVIQALASSAGAQLVASSGWVEQSSKVYLALGIVLMVGVGAVLVRNRNVITSI